MPDFDVYTLAKSALEHGIAIVPSSVFYQDNTDVTSALRLNFTHACIEEIGEAINRLA